MKHDEQRMAENVSESSMHMINMLPHEPCQTSVSSPSPALHRVVVKHWDAFESGHCGHWILIHQNSITDGPPSIVLIPLVPAVCAAQADAAIRLDELSAVVEGFCSVQDGQQQISTRACCDLQHVYLESGAIWGFP